MRALQAAVARKEADVIVARVAVDCAFLVGAQELDEDDPEMVGPWDDKLVASFADSVLAIARGRVNKMLDAVEQFWEDARDFPEVREAFDAGNLPGALDLAERLGINVESCRRAIRVAIGSTADVRRVDGKEMN